MKARVVSFHCVLKNKLGKVLSSTFNHEVITEMDGENPLLRGLVEGMQDLKKGEKRSISVPAEKAYGFYDPRLSVEIARSDVTYEGKLSIGQRVNFPDYEGKPRSFRVTRITAQSIFLDANHALAGEDLVFDIEATESREMTPDESAEIHPVDKEKRYLH